MTFLSALALAIGFLVAAPWLAHRLRRQRAEERDFAPARLVPSAPPKARRRARLEDRSLFFVRAASVIALALLGASPFVHCSRVAMSRSGTSVAVAIVLDDSMSMRAPMEGGKSRFDAAKEGAREVLAALREGDSAAIVLGGAPARVGLASTTDLSAARAALDGIDVTDRATDLDGALAIAKTLVSDLPQIDRRAVVLSDLADGAPDGPALGEGEGLPVWFAMPELRANPEQGDCALLTADRLGGRVRTRFACTGDAAARGRDVRLMDGDRVVASARLPETTLGEAMVVGEAGEGHALYVELSGKDAIASDDRAPVVTESGPAAIAVVGDPAAEAVATGGAPVVEQALAALRPDMAIRPLPQLPERREDLAAFAAIIVDDPPGFTPEQRHALVAFIEHGGLLMVALGRRAAAAPLGANFEPLLVGPVTFGAPPTPPGARAAGAAPFFDEAVESLSDLGAKGRATLKDEDVGSWQPLLGWSDGAPLILRKSRGRGETWLVTLPFSVENSDLALRPGFLSMLEAFVGEAKSRAVVGRTDVGVPWTFPPNMTVEAKGPAANGKPGARVVIPGSRDDAGRRVVPERIGAYDVTVDGAKEVRVASPLAREVDLRPRRVATAATSSSLGGGQATIDVSWLCALALLALFAVEIVLRAVTVRPSETT